MDLLPFDEYVRSLPRKRMSAGALFRSEDGRVLLVEPSYKATWDLPGGVVEAGESPWAALRREVAEEVSIDLPGARLLVVDYLPDDGRMPEGIAFIFDGGLLTPTEVDAFILTDPEILSARLCSLHEVRALVGSDLARRIEVAATAAAGQGLVLCEKGVPCHTEPTDSR